MIPPPEEVPKLTEGGRAGAALPTEFRMGLLRSEGLRGLTEAIVEERGAVGGSDGTLDAGLLLPGVLTVEGRAGEL